LIRSFGWTIDGSADWILPETTMMAQTELLQTVTGGGNLSLFDEKLLDFYCCDQGRTMRMLSSKRQVTLPKASCDRLRIQPGDQVEFFEHNGRITILKKTGRASAGALRHLKANARFSDEESLRVALVSKRAKVTAKRRAA